MKNDLPVPKHRIPQVFLPCPKCDHGTKQLQGQSFADGYHRRHRCKDDNCQYTFYSLASYDQETVQISPLPFKDRPLTPWEEQIRCEWWEETEPVQVVTHGVTMFADPVLGRINQAMKKEEGVRTETDRFIVELISRLKQELEKMDDQQEQVSNGRR